MSHVPATIAIELMEHADGRPVAYIDATDIAVFTWQQPDGTFVIAIYTRHDRAYGRVQLLVDGEPQDGTGPSHAAQAPRSKTPATGSVPEFSRTQ